MKAKKWYDYLWIAELLYLALGLTNILFAWLGMLFFSIPLLIALFGVAAERTAAKIAAKNNPQTARDLPATVIAEEVN